MNLTLRGLYIRDRRIGAVQARPQHAFHSTDPWQVFLAMPSDHLVGTPWSGSGIAVYEQHVRGIRRRSFAL